MALVPNTITHWLDRTQQALLSAGFDIFVGKTDNIRDEWGADRKQDKMSTLMDGITKSINAQLVTQLAGKKILVVTGKKAQSTMLTALPAPQLLTWPLSQAQLDIVKDAAAKKVAPPPNTNQFMNAFGKLNVSPNITLPPQNQSGHTPEQEDKYIALAAKELFKGIAGHLEPIMEREGTEEGSSIMTFRIGNKASPMEIAASLFAGGDIDVNGEGALFMTYGFVKPIVSNTK